MDSSLRPKERPQTVLSPEDLERIERVVWGEANTEGVEGRDAIRGVILNRLASDRFGNSVVDVLTPDQFEPVRKYKGINNIPVPEDDLQRGINEFADYAQLGNDPTEGRTFFQNAQITKKRGTDFNGPDPKVIGKHTFYRGYGDQEPVLDTNFSHNVRVDYSTDDTGESYQVAKYARGGFSRGRKDDTDDKFDNLRDAFRKRRNAKRDEAVAVDIEAATSQPMSVEEKRNIEGAVESSADAAKKGGARNTLFTETDALINTPEELERRENAPNPKTPEMTTDVKPQTTKLPAMYETNPSGDAEQPDGDFEDKPKMSLYHGGDVTGESCPCGGRGCGLCGGMMAPQSVVGYDPVSGNPIPLGSSAENVRDDIPAALSTGEYVMPADVVRWHGLKHIMDMYSEAKVGLMAMASIGQIRGIGEEDYVENGYSSVSGNDEGNERDDYETVDEEPTDDDGVDYPEVEVIEEEYPLEEEDSEGVEAYPTEESGQYSVGDEQVLLIFQTPK